MLSISTSKAWHETHPGGLIGLLEISGVEDCKPGDSLELHKRKVEVCLREEYGGFSRQDFLSLPVIAAYDRYYKHFKKTSHILLQIESIVQKGKNLPTVTPLVDANFVAEVETFILTAGHDADRLFPPVTMDVSREGEIMTLMNGSQKDLYPGDMLMRDSKGICCSIIYGQDNRSQISETTTHALYVAYAPPGITNKQVEDQLAKIEANIRLFSGNARVEQLNLITG